MFPSWISEMNKRANSNSVILSGFTILEKRSTMRLTPLFISLFFVQVVFSQLTDCDRIDRSFSGDCETYYESGQRRSMAQMKNGEPHGTVTTYYENGKIESVSNYQNGLPEGEVSGLYPSGEKKYEGEWLDGQATIKRFRKDGSLNEIHRFEGYSLVEKKYVDKDGNHLDALTVPTPVPTAEKLEVLDDDQAELLPIIDKEPEFPGGEAALYKYIVRSVNYPIIAIEKNIQGTVFMSFIVEADGSITGITVERGVHELLDKEAIRVIKRMPLWTPGEMNGRAVRVKQRIPVRFRLVD